MALKQWVPLALLLVVATAELDPTRSCSCSGGLCCSKNGLESVGPSSRVGIRGSEDESNREIKAFFDHFADSHQTGCKCVLRITLKPPNLMDAPFSL